MNVLAFALGLVVLGLVKADVSHLKNQQTYVANNGQFVKQSFNRNGDASFNSQSYTAGSPNGFFAQQQFDSGRIQQSSSCADSNSACVAPKFCFNGFIDQSAAQKATRSASGKCYAPEVCCRFAQRRNAPFNQDNTVAAAESTSEILTKEGYVVRKPSNQYLPGFPDRNPAPSNDQPSIYRPTPAPQRPTPQRPAPPPPQRPVPVPQRPAPQPPRVVPQPRPQPRPTPYQPQPTENRPVIQYDPAPIVVPVGCAAALNCTNIQYCTASGVISKTPVTLTPQQEMFRVPLTDCREPTTNQVGKCCRDPDYTDPWPVGRTGQYVAEELNAVFNDGSYKGQDTKTVPVRVKVQQDGYVLPQPTNTQQRLYLPPNRI